MSFRPGGTIRSEAGRGRAGTVSCPAARARSPGRRSRTRWWATRSGLGERVTAISGRPVFDLIRERLGPRVALANLAGSLLVTVLTLGAEMGGVGLALELATSVSYLLWVPVVAFVLWVALWRVKFDTLENVVGIAGLALVIFLVAFFRLHPDVGSLWHQASHPGPPKGEDWGTYWFFAVALFASALTP